MSTLIDPQLQKDLEIPMYLCIQCCTVHIRNGVKQSTGKAWSRFTFKNMGNEEEVWGEDGDYEKYQHLNNAFVTAYLSLRKNGSYSIYSIEPYKSKK